MKSKIDITMTSVLRPFILLTTLKTILKNVCKGNINRFRLIINVDPIGEDVDPFEIIKIAKDNFNNVTFNIAKTPSFPKAVKWVWSQVTAPYIFHWEDDIDILYPIDVNEMIDIHRSNPKIASLRLLKSETPNKETFRTDRCTWTYNKQGFYLTKSWREQFSLNPSLIKREFVSKACDLMVDDINPEKQFRYTKEYMVPLIKKWNYALYTKPGKHRMIDGRKGQRWKNEMKLQKPNLKAEDFLVWVKVKKEKKK